MGFHIKKISTPFQALLNHKIALLNKVQIVLNWLPAVSIESRLRHRNTEHSENTRETPKMLRIVETSKVIKNLKKLKTSPKP